MISLRVYDPTNFSPQLQPSKKLSHVTPTSQFSVPTQTTQVGETLIQSLPLSSPFYFSPQAPKVDSAESRLFTEVSFKQSTHQKVKPYSVISSPSKLVYQPSPPCNQISILHKRDIEAPFEAELDRYQKLLDQTEREIYRLRSVNVTEKLTLIHDTTKQKERERLNVLLQEQIKQTDDEIEIMKQETIIQKSQHKLPEHIEDQHSTIKREFYETEITLRAEIHYLRQQIEKQHKEYDEKISNLKKKISQSNEEHQNKKKNENNLIDKANQMTQELQNLQNQLATKNLMIKRIRDRVNEVDKLNLDKNFQIQFQKGEIQKMEEIIERKNAEIKTLTQNKKTPVNEKLLQSLKNEYDRLQIILQHTQEEYELTRKGGETLVKQQLVDLQKRKKEIDEQINQRNSEINLYTQRIKDELEKQLRTINSQQEIARFEKRNLKNE